MSKYYICKLFSKHLQTTFNDYLLKVRLKNAETQLRETTATVSEISLHCGLNSATYFCHVFEENFGVSPLKYRALLVNATNSKD
ncbi:MAG: helix-turn-helix transcriptional regulator [Clostridia bacterium]|nr:helix-turn-helix transcriptional regulator [Clostridia bacterium]